MSTSPNPSTASASTNSTPDPTAGGVADDTDADGDDDAASVDVGDPTDDPHELFETYIRRDPTVCDTCFRRTREHIPAPPDRYFDSFMDRTNRHSSETLKALVTDRAIISTGGTYCYPPPKSTPNGDDPYKMRPDYGQIVCEACGHIDADRDASFGAGLTGDYPDCGAQDAALTLSVCKRALARCISRVQEAGVSVADDAAFDALTHIKTTPAYTTRDADIVAMALAIGVKRASLPTDS